MKISDLGQARMLDDDLRTLARAEAWQLSVMRSEPTMELYANEGRVTLKLTLDEADAAIARYRSSLERRADNLGIQLDD